jgi:hypothetical protein
LLRAVVDGAQLARQESDGVIFDNLFQLMAEKKASDIFVTAGAPIHIKIQGHDDADQPAGHGSR